MLKEIVEQPSLYSRLHEGRINIEGSNVVLSAVIDYKEVIECETFYYSSCGTSWHTGLIGKHLLKVSVASLLR